MEKLQALVEEAMGQLEGTLSGDQADEVAKVIEAAIIRGVLEGQHRAVDTCNECDDVEQGAANKIASAIREKNDLLIVNLSSLR